MMSLKLAQLCGLAIAALSLLGLPRHSDAQDAPPTPENFDSFRLVLSRNVFDPERRAVVRRGPSGRGSASPGTVRSSLTLTGTMVTPTKSLAFFSSPRPGYSKVAGVNDLVGDLKVLEIAPSEVMLEQAGQKVPLSVGKQLPLAGGEPGPDDAAAGSSTEAAPAASGTSDSPAAPVSPITGPTGAPGSREETLRRMMERRQKEMSR